MYVISNDTGFDPLIKHLKSQNICCRRSNSIADIPLIKISNLKSVPERVDTIIENLIKRKAAKPRTLKTLSASIKNLFANQLCDDELESLLAQLRKRGVIKISDDEVVYDLPT